MEPTYKLEELARAADVSPRTVRYYVQRGLLPAPTFRGKDTAYTEAHLRRLQAIRKLQDQHLPLDAILAELERRSADEIVKDGPPAPIRGGRVTPVPRPPSGSTWRRVEITDGVELHVRDDVAAPVGNLVDALTKLLGQGGPYR